MVLMISTHGNFIWITQKRLALQPLGSQKYIWIVVLRGNWCFFYCQDFEKKAPERLTTCLG